jgi:hypothetical protein
VEIVDNAPIYKGNESVWHPLNIVLHLMWGVAVIILMRDFHFVDPQLYSEVYESGAREPLNLAVQLGRLDLVSLMIGVFSVAIAVATIVGFWFYRGVVEKTAKEETSEILPDVLAKHFRDDPGVIMEAMKRNREVIKLAAEDDDDGEDFYAEIAASMDGPDGSED